VIDTRVHRSGRLLMAGAALGMGLALTACGSGKSLESSSGSSSSGSPGAGSAAGGSGALTIGSAGFTESELLAQMYAQLLGKAGFSTHITQVANRELYEPALEKGQISVVPEYAATMAEFLNQKANGTNAEPVASPDLQTTVTALNRLAQPLGLKALTAGKAVDQNAFAVSKGFAAQHHLSTLSDLGRSGTAVKLAAGDECKTRPYCMPGLEKTYGIKFSGLDPKGVDTPQSKQAVKNGQDQIALVTTTDATLGQFGLVALKDDKHLQNADYLLPMVNARTAGGAKVAAALNPLASVLTTADLAGLDQKVDGQREQPKQVAQAYLKSKGLL
jgi:osmoprotectant transport system substrate-binding protein